MSSTERQALKVACITHGRSPTPLVKSNPLWRECALLMPATLFQKDRKKRGRMVARVRTTTRGLSGSGATGRKGDFFDQRPRVCMFLRKRE